MTRNIPMLAALIAVIAPIPAMAQDRVSEAVPIAPGTTRLDLSVTGSVSRVPDLAIISAGVRTRAPGANEAMAQNRALMARVLAALDQAGVEERDIRTSNISLSPDYRYQEGQSPRLIAYNANNMVTVKFRDLEDAGGILDALVAAGANQINGPTLTIDDASEARDEARLKAVAEGRARAELYAAAIGKTAVNLVMISETGTMSPTPLYARGMMAADAMESSTTIIPGEQDIAVTVQMSFDLR